MKARGAIRQRPRVVGVITSRADLVRAVRMQEPPDLFELRLDCLADVIDQVKKIVPKLRAPLIITARDPREGGAGNLSLRQRRDLLARFLDRAAYLDVELRSASALRELLAMARKKKIPRIISFHNFKSTSSSRVLAAKARAAKAHGADVFKVATRTDNAMELGRLLNLITNKRVNVPLAVMGLGKLGAISRVLLTRAGSVLVYASVGAATRIEGQLSLQQLRGLGVGTTRKRG
jgi:3-dehydroquinate dehydratase type I